MSSHSRTKPINPCHHASLGIPLGCNLVRGGGFWVLRDMKHTIFYMSCSVGNFPQIRCSPKPRPKRCGENVKRLPSVVPAVAVEA